MRDLVVERALPWFARSQYEFQKKRAAPFLIRRCPVCGCLMGGVFTTYAHELRAPLANGATYIVTCSSHYCRNTDPRL